MATFSTVTTDDLQQYALWLSGEPTDGTSDYNDRIVQHMNTVYQTFVNGGTLGTRDIATSAGLYEHVVDIPTTDWLWLRKYPPFAFNTTAAIIGSAASVVQSGPPPETIGTVSVTTGSTLITFSIAPSKSVANWRLRSLVQAAGVAFPPLTVPRIISHIAGATIAVLDAPWPQDTQSMSNFVLIQLEYALPTDFVRFCESPYVHGGWGGMGGGWTSSSLPRLAIGSVQQVGDQFPITQISQGPPTAAGRFNTETIQLNTWDAQSYRIEFTYVFSPLTLQVGISQQPVIPLRYRHVLAIGAAMLVMQDKVDSRGTSLASEFREIVAHLGIEYRKEQSAGSELAGRHLFRANQRRRGMLRTTSGLPLFSALLAFLGL